MDQVIDVLFDSTAILGAYLAESNEREICRAALRLAEQGAVRGWISGHGICVIAEEVGHTLGLAGARRILQDLRGFLGVAEMTEGLLDAAILRAGAAPAMELEDALTIETAAACGHMLIVSLNAADLASATNGAIAPLQLLDRFEPLTGTG